MLEINNTTSAKINPKKFRAIADKFARAHKLPGEISLALVGAARIKSLNRRYRGLNKATDILSFIKENEIIINISAPEKFKKYQEMLAELDLDIKIAAGAAPKKRRSEYLLYFLFVHGLLHLAGYDDKTETGRQKMIKRGRDFLEKIGYGPTGS